MKKTIINILWFFINKLDPLSVSGLSINEESITIKFKKRFLRKNKWEHVSSNVSFWIKKGDKDNNFASVEIYKNAELDKMYLTEITSN